MNIYVEGNLKPISLSGSKEGQNSEATNEATSKTQAYAEKLLKSNSSTTGEIQMNKEVMSEIQNFFDSILTEVSKALSTQETEKKANEETAEISADATNNTEQTPQKQAFAGLLG